MNPLRGILEPGERLLYCTTTWKSVGVPFGAFLLAVVWPVIMVLPELLWMSRRLAPWTVAVTDRRVLLRKRLFSNRYTDIGLSEIAHVEHDPPPDRLVLVGLEHVLEIRCNEREAVEILKALQGAYNPPKSLWQRLRRRWQAGRAPPRLRAGADYTRTGNAPGAGPAQGLELGQDPATTLP